jgi:hypothetical protein
VHPGADELSCRRTAVRHLQHRLDATAVGMAQHDDVGDTEMDDGILDRAPTLLAPPPGA